jgi:predicted PurR-regulated permease PerM
MNEIPQTVRNAPVRQSIEIAVNLLLVFLIVAWCLKILAPFISLICWGAVIAISIYNPFLKLRSFVGGRNGLAVALITLIGLSVVIVPTWMFAETLIEGSSKFAEEVSSDTYHLPAPNEKVKDWPLVGEKVYVVWSDAADNLGKWLQKYPTQVKNTIGTVLSKTAGLGMGVIQFILSILIAAMFLSNAESVARAMNQLALRLTRDKGEEMLNLAVMTVRSVAVGVLGIAFIQALLAGVGMLIANVPATGLWALLVLILAIAQLPPLFVLLPIIFYVFSAESTGIAVFFLIWSILVGASDMVLKPLMLGRGVEAPMLVILLGAIGGMIASGIIGLFLGAVILALGYILFKAWVSMDESEELDTSEQVES